LDVAVPTKRDTYSNVVLLKRIGGQLSNEIPMGPGNSYDQAFQIYIGLGQAF
jgi:hypothetical protein